MKEEEDRLNEVLVCGSTLKIKKIFEKYITITIN